MQICIDLFKSNPQLRHPQSPIHPNSIAYLLNPPILLLHNNTLLITSTISFPLPTPCKLPYYCTQLFLPILHSKQTPLFISPTLPSVSCIRCIGVTWLLAMVLMTPVAVFQEHRALDTSAPPSRFLQTLNGTGGQGQAEGDQAEGQVTTQISLVTSQSSGHVRHICREIWPDMRAEQAYTLLLDLMLLVLPVVIMSLAYSKVVHVLMYDVRSSLDMAAVGNGKSSLCALRPRVWCPLRSRHSCGGQW